MPKQHEHRRPAHHTCNSSEYLHLLFRAMIRKFIPANTHNSGLRTWAPAHCQRLSPKHDSSCFRINPVDALSSGHSFTYRMVQLQYVLIRVSPTMREFQTILKGPDSENISNVVITGPQSGDYGRSYSACEAQCSKHFASGKRDTPFYISRVSKVPISWSCRYSNIPHLCSF